MAIRFDNTNTGSATLKPAASGTLVLTLPTADGTSGQALTTDGSGQLSFSTVGGGGLTGFTAAESTTAPNATVYVDSLTASAASTDADVAFVAKGGGATLAQVPDSSGFGGDKRGAYATDWQKVREGSSQVASGAYSVISGGRQNASTNSDSVVAGGNLNIASGFSSVIGGGIGNTASNDVSGVCSGDTNTASGYASFVGGGQGNTADGAYSLITGGRFGSTRAIVGNAVFPACSSPIDTVAGVSQSALLVLGVATTNATATKLRSDTNAAGTGNQVILPNNSAYYFRGTVVAGVTGAGSTSSWSFEGTIKRGANAASTTLVGTPVLNLINQDAGASTWVVALTADTSNGGLAVTVTGQASTTIRWVAKIETTEMTF
jgi:hypothetical protein